MKRLIATAILLSFLTSCGYISQPEPIGAEDSQSKTTPTQEPTTVRTNTPTPTKTATLTIAITPTPKPQIFQQLFPSGYGHAGVAANHYDPKYPEQSGLHFDVGIPTDFVPEQDSIIFPASGQIIESYNVGEEEGEGECIIIEPYPSLQGINELVLSFGRDPNDVKFVYYHLAHIFPYKTSGWIDAGEEAGVVFDRMTHIGQWSNIVAFVVRIGFEYDEIQASPCELPNEFDWCNTCYPGAVERNPCP